MDKNKIIAKNTIYLYFRSLLMMAVGFYSSRVILEVLGIEDYGLYGAIGSIVMMFTMINGVLSVGTSRFLTYELGKNNSDKLRKTFSASFILHAILAIILFVLLETVGLWFVNCKMNIPAERVFAANIVYQLSILSSMLSLTQIPYSACIIAHEKMNIYAFVGIAEVSFKLLLIWVLLYVPFSDYLIVYAAILATWSVGVQIWYRIYCRKHFHESDLQIVKDKNIYKSMLSYSLWDFFGQFCYVGNSQGVNILINMFFGLSVNAALSVATQVESQLTKFTSNFMTSVNPQIVKSYACCDYNRYFKLIFESAKYSFYLLFFLSLPIFLECDYILNLWLVDVPTYSSLFLRFILVISLFGVMERPIIYGIHATGNVKMLNLTNGLFQTVTFLPFIYLLYKLGFSVWYCFIVQSFNIIFRAYFEIRVLYSQLKFDIKEYLVTVYARPIGVALLASIVPILGVKLMEASFQRLLSTCILSVLSISCMVYYMGIDKNIRKKIKSYVISKITR
ncbi:MAG: MATE family efflux transporter [Prevotella sp.]|nr:MATE family efflux transporter [Prevotella sp.]